MVRVGILADNNTWLTEGVFVDFFGIPACTTAGLARFALHTGAAVVAGVSPLGRGSQEIPALF